MLRNRLLLPCPIRPLLVLILLLGSATGFAQSVKDFGAIGDGEADDTAAIQQALDAGKGVVELPAGRYRLTATLRVPSKSGLRGPGTLYMEADATTLMNADEATSLTDIRLDGFRVEKQFVMNSVHDGIRIVGARNVVIDGVEVTGISCCYGISLERCENFAIRNCYIHDFKSDWTERKLPGGRSLDSLGIHLRYSKWGQVTGNRIENLNVSEASANAMAYQTDGINPGWCSQLVIANNIIRNVGEGIDLVHCESTAVTGNAIDTCWHFGIKVIHGSRLVTLTGNTIRDASLAGMSLYFGGSNNGESYGNVVNGNTIANTGAITRAEDASAKGIWRGWPTCGIEIVNDNQPNNSVHDYVITGNVICDDQSSATCQYGVIERYITIKTPGLDPLKTEAVFEHEPIDDGGLFSNIIAHNLIRGVKTKAYRTGSAVHP